MNKSRNSSHQSGQKKLQWHQPSWMTRWKQAWQRWRTYNIMNFIRLCCRIYLRSLMINPSMRPFWRLSLMHMYSPLSSLRDSLITTFSCTMSSLHLRSYQRIRIPPPASPTQQWKRKNQAPVTGGRALVWINVADLSYWEFILHLYYIYIQKGLTEKSLDKNLAKD